MRARWIVWASAFVLCIWPGALKASAHDAAPPKEAPPGPVKVFILAGQSNMEGYGHVRTLPRLAELPGGQSILDGLRGPAGSWTVRDDVFVYFRGGERVGPLGVGFGASEDRVGPEFAFGVRMGEHYKEPVLLIKTAWGGKDLHFDFRPPSAGPLPYPIDPEAFAQRGGPAAVGESYRNIVKDVHDCLDKMGTYFPSLQGREYEIVGLVWFQGWNEMFPAKGCAFERVVADYPALYTSLVNDLGREFHVEKLPSVVGELGVNGEHASGNIIEVRKRQAAIAEVPELKGRVRFVRTADLWDPKLDEMQERERTLRRSLREGLAPAVEAETLHRIEGKPDKERREIMDRAMEDAITKTSEYREWNDAWERIAAHWECHYWGSAPVYCRIGDRLGKAMEELLASPTGGAK